MAWRKSWEANWEEVKYCSASCRRRKIRKIDQLLESRILELLERKPRGSSIRLSEAAKDLDPSGWKGLLEPARRAARRLASRGEIEIRQQGANVAPSTAKGDIRLIRKTRDFR